MPNVLIDQETKPKSIGQHTVDPGAIDRYLFLGRLRIYSSIVADELRHEFTHNRRSANRLAAVLKDLQEVASSWSRFPRPEAGSLREATIVHYAMSFLDRAHGALIPFQEGDEAKLPDPDPVQAIHDAADSTRLAADLLTSWQVAWRNSDEQFSTAVDGAPHRDIVGVVKDKLQTRLNEYMWACDEATEKAASPGRGEPLGKQSDLCRAHRDLYFFWFHTLTQCPGMWSSRLQIDIAWLLDRGVSVLSTGRYKLAAARRHFSLLAFFPPPFETAKEYFRQAAVPPAEEVPVARSVSPGARS